MGLDLLDKKILYELDLDARVPATAIARRLNRSKETIQFRINRLHEKGFIKGFYAILNTSKLGWYYYKIFLKLKNITPKIEQELLIYLSKQNNIAYLASIEGYYNCIFLVMVRDPEDFLTVFTPFLKLFGSFIQEKEIMTVLTAHRLNQRFLYEGKIGESKDDFYQIPIKKYFLVEIDKGILKIISSNARMPLSDIAVRLKEDAKLVKYRLQRLKKEGIILSYVTSINFEILGLQSVQINISLKDLSVKAAIIQFFSETNVCLFVVELLGKYDLTIELHIERNEQLKRIIDAFRTRFANQYTDYDITTINKEYVMVWSPFSD